MIALGAKCLLFQSNNGESVPLSADMISIELSGEASQVLDQEHVDEAAEAVFHYFKHDLNRETVTMAEFSEALEKALKGLRREAPAALRRTGLTAATDLAQLARECGAGCELVFFPRLRNELRVLLRNSPDTVTFSGLKGCVKELTGARRWTAECRSLKTQILSFLRGCLRAESTQDEISVVVK
jgi:hypothetical protein